MDKVLEIVEKMNKVNTALVEAQARANTHITLNSLLAAMTAGLLALHIWRAY